MPQIIIRSSGGVARQIPLGMRTTIGRAEDSHIRLANQSLSRRHAEIRQREGGCYLIDLGSTNGTYLNGVRLADERALRDGDVIVLGEVTLMFREGSRPDPAAEPFADEFNPDLPEPTRVTLPERPLPSPAARAFPLVDLVRRATRRGDLAAPLPDARVMDILTEASGALLSHH